MRPRPFSRRRLARVSGPSRSHQARARRPREERVARRRTAHEDSETARGRAGQDPRRGQGTRSRTRPEHARANAPRRGEGGHRAGIALRAGARKQQACLARHRLDSLGGRLKSLQAHGRRHRRLLRRLPARWARSRYHLRAELRARLSRRAHHLRGGAS